jgi:CMD domain protein
MTIAVDDIIDHLAGIKPGSTVDLLRRQRPITRDQSEASFRALFAPVDASDVTLTERLAVAAFVAGLHGDAAAIGYYGATLAKQPDGPALGDTIADEVKSARAQGPYGAYPAGPLSSENLAGPVYQVGPVARSVLDERLSAALEHAHLLVLHPRDASPDALKALAQAGWSATGIITLSQLVSFLAYQIRVAAGLAVLDA